MQIRKQHTRGSRHIDSSAIDNQELKQLCTREAKFEEVQRHYINIYQSNFL